MLNKRILVMFVAIELVVGLAVLVLSLNDDLALLGKFVIAASIMAFIAAATIVVMFQRFLTHAFRSEDWHRS